MEYRTFGRTGLRASIAGLGGGGASRLGLATGSSEREAVGVVRHALAAGITYIDTSERYGTEGVIGLALEGRRDSVALSSKIAPRKRDGSLIAAKDVRVSLEGSLTRLRTDVIDVYHLHRLRLNDYAYLRAEIVPELEKLRDEGKIRFLALSESTSSDPSHDALLRAVEDDCWDVMMVGFNLFNQSVRQRVLPRAIEKGIAIEVMASAREHFSRPELMVTQLAGLVEQGAIDPQALDSADPLGFLTEAEISLAEASYRFAAYEPGVHVVLVGTGNTSHLDENVAAINAGPLPAEIQQRLLAIFGHLSSAVYVPGRKRSPEEAESTDVST